MSVLKENEAAGVDRATQFALGAASQALAASGLDTGASPERIGVYWGTGLGGASTQGTAYRQVYGADERRLRPLTVVMAMSNAARSNVAMRPRLRRPLPKFSPTPSSS